MIDLKPGKTYLKIVVLFVLSITAYTVIQQYEIVPPDWQGKIFALMMVPIFMAFGAIDMLREYGFIKKKPLPDDYKLPGYIEPLVVVKTQPGDTSFWNTPGFWMFIAPMLIIFVIGPSVYFILVSIPPSIFDGKTFVNDRNVQIFIIVLELGACVYCGYRCIKAFTGR